MESFANVWIQGDFKNEWWNPNEYQRETIEKFIENGSKVGKFIHLWLNGIFYGYQQIDKLDDGKLFIGDPKGKLRMLIFDDNLKINHDGAPWRKDTISMLN